MNTRSTTKRSASLVEDETNSFSAEGPVISVSPFERLGEEGDAVAHRLEAHHRLAGRALRA